MKRLKNLLLITISLCSSLVMVVVANCKNRDGKHLDPKVHRCTYTQKDIKRGFAKCPERYKCMGIDENTCFYCGCHIRHHSEKQED